MKPPDEFAATVIDTLALLGPVTMSRFFGGYGLKFDGAQFAMIFKGALYLRADPTLAAELIPRGSTPFEYERTGRLA
jgi:DNA transformation protein